jgi:NADH:ubiquinone reductase (H+-translocating)
VFITHYRICANMQRMQTTNQPRVIIIGCGFGGLEAAKALAGKPVDVTIIDRCNHHLFQPLLYQVATAGLSAPSIAAPIRHIFRKQRNITVLMGEVTAIDAAQRTIRIDGASELAYDHLIVAAGATHSYFGNDAWAAHAPGLKTLEDAFAIRRRVLLAFEHAEREADAEKRRAWLTFAVIGAGATGVELAGAFAEIARHTLTGEFRRFDSRAARVLLLEGGPRVLPAFPEKLSDKARRQLERLGVEVRTGARVTAVHENGVDITEGDAASRIEAHTIMWAAGVAASPLGKTLGVPLDRAGRVVVQPDLSLAAYPEISVIGDLAAVTSRGKPVPGVSPAAKQMGRRAARNILVRVGGGANSPTREFHYRDYGTLATIGRKSAVAIIGKLQLWGMPAWLTWLFAHVYFLIGFRNRLTVMIDWAWAYFSFQRHARIVIGAWKRERPL